jgi:hypothetical protein
MQVIDSEINPHTGDIAMINPNTANPAQAQMMTRMKLEKQLRGGASWFYWIAGLSVINSIIYILNFSLTFVVGLGIAQLVDGISAGIAEFSDPSLTPIILTVGLVINIAIACGFVGLGVLGRNRKLWAIITGMVIYALDMIILAIASDWLSIIFHVIALVGLFTGLTACVQLAKLDAEKMIVPPDRLASIN